MQTALIVEDDAAIRELVCELLREMGFDQVFAAANGNQAAAVAATAALKLVVLDHRLGAESGVDVADRLRSLPGFNAAVLVTTALSRKQAEEVCAKAQACECVSKPFDISDFLRAVQTCLAEHSPSLAS